MANSGMETVDISYRIKLNKDQTEVFDFKLDAETFELVGKQASDLPKWAELEFKQCSHCPLNSEEHSHCPVAVQMVDAVERFSDTTSIDEVEMEVITEERRVIQTTALQRAITSMFELLFPACGCPKTEIMRPLSRFHLPLASEEENVFRVTGMYLLGQYFLNTSNQSGRIDFKGLIEEYSQMSILNKAIASRLQHSTQSDSVKNAIALLDMYSTLVPLLLEDELVEMRGFFKAFLPEEEVNETPVAKPSYLKNFKEASLELEPIAGENPEDTEPAWLKELHGESDEEKTTVSAVQEKQPEEKKESSKIDEILADSELTLSLEPIAGEAKEKPITGRASFDLPDD